MFVAGSVLLDGKVKQIRNLTCFPGQQAASQAGQAIADQSPSQQAGWSKALKFRHVFEVVSFRGDFSILSQFLHQLREVAKRTVFGFLRLVLRGQPPRP